jgi:hypothetical protein
MPPPYIQTFVGIANAATAYAANLAAAQADNPGMTLVAAADTTLALGPDGVTYTLSSDFTLAAIPGS